eukprot:scaffold13269_cov68-Phaeocystis_antarctica.AAC.1
MYRDESETHLDDGHSHNFATAFLRNLRCSAVMGINVWACQTPGYQRPRTGHTAKHHSRQQLATTRGSNRARAWNRRDDTVAHVEIAPKKVSSHPRSRQPGPETCAPAT